jgi:hypothetical protein
MHERAHRLQLLHVPGRTRGRGNLEEGRVVTNGMSQYSRAEFNANSGLVVDIDPERDYPGGPLAGIAFQRHWESLAFRPRAGRLSGTGAESWVIFWPAGLSTEFGAVMPSYSRACT